MNTEPGLSDYARGHLFLMDISKRFDAVIKRNPKYTNNWKTWQVEHARGVGRQALRDYPHTLYLCDLYLKEKP